MITNQSSGTSITEVADKIYRISTPVPPEVVPGGFSFNQYLLRGEAPLLFHTGLRRMFPLVCEAIEAVMPINKLRYVGLSHVEADESGAINEFLSVAPHAVPVCGKVAALVSMNDLADRMPIALADGEMLSLGSHRVKWLDAPHMPHGWETGYLFEDRTATLLCGDLFTQPGRGEIAVTESDILEPSESFRGMMDYYSHTKAARPLLQKLAATKPTTLACMHGSAWRGDGASLIMALADRLDA
jgi:flavorubredoxin